MNIKRLRLFLFAFALLATQHASAQCEYRLDLFDSFGEGWNGGTVTVSVGADLYKYSLDDINDDGKDSTIIIPVTAGLPITLSWTPGFFDLGVVSFNFYNSDNDLLLAASAPVPGLLFSDSTACPTCPKPQNFRLENVWDNRVRLRWTPVAGSTALGWYVIVGPKGFVPGTGAGDSLYVPTPKATVAGLTENTEYDFFIVQDCGMGDLSGLTGPISVRTYWSDDVGISGVTAPLSSCGLGVETVKILIKNYGANPQSLIPFNYSVNGVAAGVPQPEDGFYTGVLGKDSAELIEFETKFNFSAPGEYEIAVWSGMMGDEDSSNDTFIYRITNRLQAPYQQDFETWSGGWYVDTASIFPSWQFGEPKATVISKAAKGKNAWVTNLSGNYNFDEHSYLHSPCFDFATLSKDPVIEFALNYNTELSYDGGWLELSTDDGASWKKVGIAGEGYNWYNFFNTNTNLGYVWAGESNGWKTARYRLKDLKGKSEVRFRFGFGSDDVASLEGMGIDNVRIYEPFVDDLAAVSATTAGNSDECGLEKDKVSFALTNFGTAPQVFFQVAYSINGGAPVVENVGNNVVDPEEIYTYVFNTPFDSRDGVFNIKCWTVLLNEQQNANDTVSYTVDHSPHPVPLYEDFESANLPIDWIAEGLVTNGHENTSYVLASNVWVSNPEFSTDIPRYGFISAGDSLRFDYRITNYPEGKVATVLSGGTKIEIQASTNCGKDFTTIYTINSSTHTPTATFRTRQVDLSQFAGKAISIRVLGTWGAGDFWFDLDNVNIRACPPDMNLSADVTPVTPGQNNGVATVKVGLGNPPYKYKWSTGATTESIGNLFPGEVSVTVFDSRGCTDSITIQIGTNAVSGIEGLSAFSLRPNPTTGYAQLQLRFDRALDLRADLVNLLGQSVWEGNYSNTTEVSEMLDLNSLPNGLYLLRLSTEGQVLTQKLVKSQ